MNCPFPGMDPYIERCGLWDDFHPELIGQIKRAIAPQLPGHYAVRTGERFYIDVCRPGELDPDRRLILAQSDASVVKTEKAATASSATLIEAPLECDFAVEEEFREYYLDIREARSGRIVTTIEVLSPSNKRQSTGRHQYLMKRNACVLGQRNFIEIDLLRAGQRMPLGSSYPPRAYAVVVLRVARPGKCGVWPIGLRDVLPVIPVPLGEGENELSVDMSPMVNDIYVTSRYEVSIDYNLALIPPLADEDARWMDQLLRTSGDRGA